MADDATARPALKILVFSTETISDPGIDFAGSSHLHYPSGVLVIRVPCSSGIRAEWVLAALEKGFDGVFIAADGSDCAYVPDCTRRTGELVGRAQALLREHDQNARRLKMAAVCSVCAESFVSHISAFEKELMALKGRGGEPVAAA